MLAGGDGAEAEVSRSSAAEVAAALTERRFDVRVVELDDALVGALLEFAPDVVFPVLHGPPGEDGTVQGLLAMLRLPFVGSDVRGAAAAMDKSIARSVFRDAGLPVAEGVSLAAGTAPAEAAAAVRARFPGAGVAVKPRSQGSALGVSLVAPGGDVLAPLTAALSFGDGVLVEEFVAGREITVAVLDLDGEAACALPVIEILVGEGQWYDYRNRYTPGRSRHVVPAPLPEPLAEELREAALAAHRALCLRDLSRADFVVAGDGRFVVLEVNAIPGMTPTSLYPDACRSAGIDFPTLTERLVLSAASRAGIRAPTARVDAADRGV